MQTKTKMNLIIKINKISIKINAKDTYSCQLKAVETPTSKYISASLKVAKN